MLRSLEALTYSLPQRSYLPCQLQHRPRLLLWPRFTRLILLLRPPSLATGNWPLFQSDFLLSILL